MCVHFIYEEVVNVPETIAEEFELQGVHYFCKDCPHLQKGKDKRCKSHGCKYSKYGTVQDFTPACEFFYKQLLQGEIEPEVVERVIALTKELSGCREVHHTMAGCTVATHCGPKTLGVLFIEE